MSVRLLRGQVVIRERERASETIWTPAEHASKVRTHRGTVLALGPPALRSSMRWDATEREWIFRQIEVPHGFAAGDEVIYQFVHHQQNWTREWVDGKPATWVPQEAVDAVIEP